MTIQELLEEKGRLAKQAEEVLNKAAEEKRFALNAEEEQKFDAIHADIAKIQGHVDRLQKMDSLSEPAERRTEPKQPDNRTTESRIIRPTDRTEGFRSWLLAGSDVERTPAMRAAAERAGLSLDQKSITLHLSPYAMRSTHPDHVREWEQRTAQGTTSGGVGQYTIPDETMRALEVALLNYGGMRQVATVYRTATGADLPIPAVNDTAQKGVILAENSAAAEQGVTFTQLVLQSFKYSSKYILVSVELLQDSAINVSQFIGDALGTRIGRITNEHFTTGDGSSKPRGIVAGAASGKAGVTGQTTTIIYDDFVDLYHSVGSAYRTGAKWMFADSTLKAIKKIKVPQYSGDTAGAPLWQPGLVQGQPDTILGHPYVINDDMAAMGTSAKSVLFGDLSKYIIRDVRDITLLRLDERFAEYHQVAFLAFSRHDGDLLDGGTNPVKYYANSGS